MNTLRTVKQVYRLKTPNNIGASVFTKPDRNFLDIACPLNAENKPNVQDNCWLSCGLTCAARCFRAPDAVCEGCPCLKLESYS